MNSQYHSSHQHGDDEMHRSTLNQFDFVASHAAPYNMNSHFRSPNDSAERHDYAMARDYGVPGSAFSPHQNHQNLHDQHLVWQGDISLSSHPSYIAPTAPFAQYQPGFHASYGASPGYDFYDHPFPNGLMHGNSSLPNTPSHESIMIHASRSAPSSCSTSPLVPDVAADYLDVPFRQDRSSSREHSPAKSDNDPNDSKRRFPCAIDGCGRRFTSQYTLRVHMEAHKPKPKPCFQCTLGCQEKFSRQHDRLRHEVSKHGKICEFLCHECGRFFSSRKTLGNHKCPNANGTTRWMDLN